MRVRDTQANEDTTGVGRWEPQLVFLYSLFCIIETLEIYTKFYIL